MAKTYETGQPCIKGHVAPRYVGSRNCTECQRLWYLANREQCIASASAWAKANPERSRVLRSRWVKDNPERHREIRRASRKAHPETTRVSDARYYAKYTEREKAKQRAYRKANPEKLRIKDQEYAKARPDVIRAKSARKIARKRFAPGRGISTVEFQEVLTAALGLCAYCNDPAPLELEHIEPLAKGGAHDVDNATAVCRSCNSRKSDIPLLLWLATRMVRAA